jgi:hypothetical protein
MSSVAAHYHLTGDPIGMMVVGVAGSGKTSILLPCIRSLPKVTIECDMSPASLLPGRASASHKPVKGLLDEIGNSGIVVFKDFTTFMSANEDKRRELAAAIREIADGYYRRRIGTEPKAREWHGKITFLACATYEAERQWATMRDLGERFVNIRWRIGDRLRAARKAGIQFSHERPIEEITTILAAEFFDNDSLGDFPGTVSEEYENKFTQLADAVSTLRCSVHRNKLREIDSVPYPEQPSRLNKAFRTLAIAHAALWRQAEVTAPSFNVALRVARDTIPDIRWTIISNIPLGSYATAHELHKLTRIPHCSIGYHCESLEALKIISRSDDAGQTQVRFTEPFEEIATSSGLFGN